MASSDNGMVLEQCCTNTSIMKSSSPVIRSSFQVLWVQIHVCMCAYVCYASCDCAAVCVSNIYAFSVYIYIYMRTLCTAPVDPQCHIEARRFDNRGSDGSIGPGRIHAQEDWLGILYIYIYIHICMMQLCIYICMK